MATLTLDINWKCFDLGSDYSDLAYSTRAIKQTRQHHNGIWKQRKSRCINPRHLLLVPYYRPSTPEAVKYRPSIRTPEFSRETQYAGQ